MIASTAFRCARFQAIVHHFALSSAIALTERPGIFVDHSEIFNYCPATEFVARVENERIELSIIKDHVLANLGSVTSATHRTILNKMTDFGFMEIAAIATTYPFLRIGLGAMKNSQFAKFLTDIFSVGSSLADCKLAGTAATFPQGRVRGLHIEGLSAFWIFADDWNRHNESLKRCSLRASGVVVQATPIGLLGSIEIKNPLSIFVA